MPSRGRRAKPEGKLSGSDAMAAILPILLFLVAVVAINVFEFGRPD
ncbi:MAG: hypothetical protein ACYDD1_18930 [Caulobacteraceae bacterium]